ncbi:peptidoglycan-binding protein [Arthrobacter sp. PM3]|uniref:peptidoglycan-binding protein n=1 Tax=Arthrobacter sp. PM3 TaxID=2017685 RepID=UPI000E10C972|nr:peptidoglycan-binding protein [Arthrobacter sp. PM3]AXJ08442.1 peptidoglycan-binding protein [Arthrobacter sp. PM3]
MSVEPGMTPLTDDELLAQGGTPLPDKEVASVLDLNADLNLGISAAAPIDLGVAANANVAAPIDAGASANVLSVGSESQALADQGTIINQGVTGDATADSTQDSLIDQGAGTDAGTAAAAPADAAAAAAPATADAAPADLGGALPGGTAPDLGGALPDGTVPDLGGATGALNGNLLNVDVNLDANAGIAAPINGAVAANANVAAPIDAAVGANIGSIDSNAFAVAQQDAIINQDIHGDATASADQQSDLKQ